MKRYLKPAAAVAAVLPVAAIAIDLFQGTMREPVAGVINRLGYFALFFLSVTLACTPAKILLGWTWPNRLRRFFGLTAFAYALLHLLVYTVVDKELDWGDIWADVYKRKFITVGFAAFVLMVPLAWTSRDRAVKALGFRRWKALHRLAYVSAGLGVLHFWWRVKRDIREPLLFGLVLLALGAVRLYAFARDRQRKRV